MFIGNLPYGAEEETLRDLFLKGVGADGDDDEDPVVSGVRIVRDKETQKCKGFAYVTFRDASFVALALNLHESKYMKREIRVQVCGKRTKGKKGDGINNKRSFEGQRATTSGKLLSTGKRKAEVVKHHPREEAKRSEGVLVARRRLVLLQNLVLARELQRKRKSRRKSRSYNKEQRRVWARRSRLMSGMTSSYLKLWGGCQRPPA